MKVKELISKLNELDQDMQVCFTDLELGILMITSAEVEGFYIVNSFGTHDSGNTLIKMVRLDGEYLSIEEMKTK